MKYLLVVSYRLLERLSRSYQKGVNFPVMLLLLAFFINCNNLESKVK